MIPSIAGVGVSSQKIIPTDGGAVMHALKRSDPSFTGFGEAYFSVVNVGCIRGWKRHLKMTSNLVVPAGKMRFVLIDQRANSSTHGAIDDLMLSADDHYRRLSIPPGIWTAFKSLHAPRTLLLNIADIEHDPDEVEHRPLDHFTVDWK